MICEGSFTLFLRLHEQLPMRLKYELRLTKSIQLHIAVPMVCVYELMTFDSMRC